MHYASMSLGIFDFLINWLTEFLMWIIGWVFELINTLLAQSFFSIGTSLLNIVDMLQVIFKKLSGMGTYWIQDPSTGSYGAVKDTDPLLSLITNKTVLQVFLAMSIVAIVMVIVAAIIQVIRTEFSTEGSKNSKGQIFASALKSLMMFILVPICCGGGVLVCNALLKSIDAATNLGSNNATIGSTIFVASNGSTNRVRAGSGLTEPLRKQVGITSGIDQNNREAAAMKVDEYFKNDPGWSWATGGGIFDSGSAFRPYANWEFAILYYNLYDTNYLLYIGSAVVAAWIMLNCIFGMIMRLFKAAILFMVSPPIVALMPLTASPFNSWRKSFIGQILSAYGTVAGFNLMMILLPIVNNIKLFAPLTFDGIGVGLTAGADFNGANGMVTILVTLTALFMMKDMTKMLADLINADDANSSGEGMSKKVGKMAATVGVGVATAGMGLAGAAGLAASGGKFTGLAGKMLGNGTKAGFQKSPLGKMLNKTTGSLKKGADKILGDYTGFTPFKDHDDKVKKEKEKQNRINEYAEGFGIAAEKSAEKSSKASNLAEAERIARDDRRGFVDENMNQIKDSFGEAGVVNKLNQVKDGVNSAAPNAGQGIGSDLDVDGDGAGNNDNNNDKDNKEKELNIDMSAMTDLLEEIVNTLKTNPGQQQNARELLDAFKDLNKRNAPQTEYAKLVNGDLFKGLMTNAQEASNMSISNQIVNNITSKELNQIMDYSDLGATDLFNDKINDIVARTGKTTEQVQVAVKDLVQHAKSEIKRAVQENKKQ